CPNPEPPHCNTDAFALRTQRFVVACRKLLAFRIGQPLSRVRRNERTYAGGNLGLSSAQNAGFHLVTRSHHASIQTLDEVCCRQRSSKNIRRFESMPITTCAPQLRDDFLRLVSLPSHYCPS